MTNKKAFWIGVIIYPILFLLSIPLENVWFVLAMPNPFALLLEDIGLRRFGYIIAFIIVLAIIIKRYKIKYNESLPKISLFLGFLSGLTLIEIVLVLYLIFNWPTN